VTFAASRLLGEDVTGKSLVAHDLARPGHFEALCRALMCF
jgi:hypothetical protein